MKRISTVFSRPEFHIFVFFLSLILFSWPFLTMLLMHPPRAAFTYIFGAWSGIVLILFVISRSCKAASSERKENKSNAE